jgi:hypothetical protein
MSAKQSQNRAEELAEAVANSTFVIAALMWSAFACGVAAGAVGMLLLMEAIRR